MDQEFSSFLPSARYSLEKEDDEDRKKKEIEVKENGQKQENVK